MRVLAKGVNSASDVAHASNVSAAVRYATWSPSDSISLKPALINAQRAKELKITVPTASVRLFAKAKMSTRVPPWQKIRINLGSNAVRFEIPPAAVSVPSWTTFELDRSDMRASYARWSWSSVRESHP